MSDDPTKLADDMEVPMSALAAPEVTDPAKVLAYKSALASAPAKQIPWYDKLPALKQSSVGADLGRGVAEMFANQAAGAAKLSAAEPLRHYSNKVKDANRAALMQAGAGLVGKLMDRPQQQAAAEMEMAKFRGEQANKDRQLANTERQTDISQQNADTTRKTSESNSELQNKKFEQDKTEAERKWDKEINPDNYPLTKDQQLQKEEYAARHAFEQQKLTQDAADAKAQRGLGYANLAESKRSHDLSNAEAVRAHDLQAAQQKAEIDARLAAQRAAAGEKADARADTFTTAYSKDTADDVKVLSAIDKMRQLDEKYSKKGETAPGTDAPIVEGIKSKLRGTAGYVGMSPSEADLDAQQRQLLAETIKSGVLRAESGANYTPTEEQSAAMRTGAAENATPEQRRMAMDTLEDLARGRLRTRGHANPEAAQATIKESGLDTSKIWTPTSVRVTSPDGKISQAVPAAKAAKLKGMGWSVEE